MTKARGKSGPLFSFDVHDDVRLMNDAQIEKDEVCVVLFLICMTATLLCAFAVACW